MSRFTVNLNSNASPEEAALIRHLEGMKGVNRASRFIADALLAYWTGKSSLNENNFEAVEELPWPSDDIALEYQAEEQEDHSSLLNEIFNRI